MKAKDLNTAVETNKNIDRLANAITALESSQDIQVRVFTHTRQEFVFNAYLDQEDLRRVILAESQKTLEKFKADLKELGVER